MITKYKYLTVFIILALVTSQVNAWGVTHSKCSLKKADKKPEAAALIRSETVPSAHNCRKLCSEEVTCLAVVWKESTGACSLYNSDVIMTNLDADEKAFVTTTRHTELFGPLQNVAVPQKSSCSASSSLSGYDFTCDKAMDGLYVSNGEPWASDYEGAAWIQLDFVRAFTVTQVDLYPDCKGEYQCADLSLSFSDGQTRSFARNCIEDPNCPPIRMVEYEISPFVVSTHVRITCVTKCSGVEWRLWEVLVWAME